MPVTIIGKAVTCGPVSASVTFVGAVMLTGTTSGTPVTRIGAGSTNVVLGNSGNSEATGMALPADGTPVPITGDPVPMMGAVPMIGEPVPMTGEPVPVPRMGAMKVASPYE
jgi:hypothetical protein